MGFTKRTSILIFISTIFLLSISLLFKSNITGFAAFTTEAINYIVYDYLIIILVGVIILSAISTFIYINSEQETEEELERFNVDKPNTSSENLKEYIDYCLSQGKKEKEIRSILKKAEWGKSLINDAFESIK